MRAKHLITVDEFKTLARPVSVHLDDNEITQYIDECEDMFIIPAIGYTNFKAMIEDAGKSVWDKTFDSSFNPALFADGGEWIYKGCCCGDGGELRYCKGMKTTLAYYVYAKMLRSDGGILSRAGFMRHNDEYAGHIEDNQKQYADVMNIADKYMGGCLQYMRYHLKNDSIRPLKNSRARIKVIGD